MATWQFLLYRVLKSLGDLSPGIPTHSALLLLSLNLLSINMPWRLTRSHFSPTDRNGKREAGYILFGSQTHPLIRMTAIETLNCLFFVPWAGTRITLNISTTLITKKGEKNSTIIVTKRNEIFFFYSPINFFKNLYS